LSTPVSLVVPDGRLTSAKFSLGSFVSHDRQLVLPPIEQAHDPGPRFSAVVSVGCGRVPARRKSIVQHEVDVDIRFLSGSSAYSASPNRPTVPARIGGL